MTNRLGLYKVFDEVAKCKSFSKAAKKLYMTQPAVSQSMMQLENELKVRLFARSPKGVSLTVEGELLLEYISAAIKLIEVGQEKLMESKNLEVGTLIIGVGDTISKYYLLPYLEQFHKEYPNIKLKIINRTTLELCGLLKVGEIDMAICNLPIEDTALESRALMTIQDVFVCGKKYKEEIKEPISLEDLVKLPLILLEPKANSRQYVEKFLKEKSIALQAEIELGSHDLLLEFAKINLGIAGIIREFAKEELAKGILFEIRTTEEIMPREIGICSLKGVSFSAASKRFIEMLEEKKCNTSQEGID